MTTTKVVEVNDRDAIPTTIALMGRAMQDASAFLPLRNHAAQLAARAAPHDYTGQLNHIYNDVINHWRYVRDPVHFETLVVTPPEIMQFVLGFRPDGTRGVGHGDCDEIAVGIGSMALATGFPVRIVTSSEYSSPDQWSHVFIEAMLPTGEWITLDPVLHPMKPMGGIVDAPRLGYWDLDGQRVTLQGLAGPASPQRRRQLPVMLSGPLQPGEQIIDLKDVCPFGSEFGTAIDTMGYQTPDIDVELGPADRCPDGTYIAPLLAMQPSDAEYIAVVGAPYEGMRAVGSTGYIYEYTVIPPASGLGGWFRRFFRRIGRAIKRVVRKVWGVVEKIFKATKFGRWILRVKDRILSFVVEKITPLAKWVSRFAPAIAPLTALIPGVGPAIAAVLAEAGAIAKMYKEWGVPLINVVRMIDGEEVEIGIPNFDTELEELSVAAGLQAEADKIRDAFSDAEIQELLESAPPVDELFVEGDPLAITPAQEQFKARIQARLAQKEAGVAAASAYAATDAYYARQPEIAAQQAEAINRWRWENDPEIQAAAANVAANARANSVVTQQAVAAAEYAARAADEEYQAALARERFALAQRDPAYKEAATEKEVRGLELIGFQLATV